MKMGLLRGRGWPSLFLILFLSAVLIGALLAWSLRDLKPPDEEGFPKQIVIPPGMNLLEVAEMLTSEGVLRSTYPFIFLARIEGVSSNIKAGEYIFRYPETPNEVLARLVKGEVILHRVTIPEGYTVRQIAKLFEKKGLAKAEVFIEMASDPEYLDLLGIEGKNSEGFLFPDTYYFSSGLEEKEILRKMVSRFWAVMGERERKRAKELGFSIREIVTLASMIEKETPSDQEKPLVSAVFYNRLKKGIRLESDPTVIYGLEHFDGNLRRKDLKRKSPYNTYIIRGLPPGPIANPGEASIIAALYPANVDYLYFVSRNDGTHHFSRTLSEHNRAVLKYQKRRRFREKR